MNLENYLSVASRFTTTAICNLYLIKDSSLPTGQEKVKILVGWFVEMRSVFQFSKNEWLKLILNYTEWVWI